MQRSIATWYQKLSFRMHKIIRLFHFLCTAPEVSLDKGDICANNIGCGISINSKYFKHVSLFVYTGYLKFLSLIDFMMIILDSGILFFFNSIVKVAI